MNALVRSPAALAGDPRTVPTAVVIDVLRATSTATVLTARGLDRIDIVASPPELASLPPTPLPTLVVSEMAAARGDRPWLDNSPVLVEAADLVDQRVVLVTTNGTRALAIAAMRAERVLLGCFLNLTALAQHLLVSRDEEVWLVPAGNIDRDEPRVEDTECAEALRALLTGAPPQLAERVARIRADERVQRRLVKEGAAFAADLDLCLRHDLHTCVPRFVAETPARGHVVRAA